LGLPFFKELVDGLSGGSVGSLLDVMHGVWVALSSLVKGDSLGVVQESNKSKSRSVFHFIINDIIISANEFIK
jgi:hypothetical protein